MPFGTSLSDVMTLAEISSIEVTTVTSYSPRRPVGIRRQTTPQDAFSVTKEQIS